MHHSNIVFLLFPKSHLLDLSGPAQVFHEANTKDKIHFQLHFVSAHKSLRTEQGLMFSNLAYFKDLQFGRGDFICVPGIDFSSFCRGEMDESMHKTKKWLQQQYANGAYIGSICSGALILAKMGMLNGVRSTTHWKCFSYAKKHFPKVLFVENRLYSFDKNIFTSAGMTAGIDMAIALVEKWHTPLLAARIAQEMVINIRRPETKSQQNIFLDFKNHFNPDVYKAQEILCDRMNASFTIDDLAKKMNMSARQLARLFKNHTNQTIQAYRGNLRMEHGRELLYNTELSVKEIAFQCGYESTRQFTRLWKTREGCTPQGSRKAYENSEA